MKLRRSLARSRRISGVALIASSLLGCSVAANAGTLTKSPLSVRVVLRQVRTRAGMPIPADVVITNSSRHSVKVNSCSLRESIFVGLSGKNLPFSPATNTPACFGGVSLRPGISRLQISLSTSYQECSAATPSPGIARCTKSGSTSLPKGTYQTSVAYSGLPATTRAPASITVTLT